MSDTSTTSDELGATSGEDEPTASADGATGEASAPPFRYPRLRRLEIWKPPTDGLHGYVDVSIRDPQGIDPRNIIKSKHDFEVCCELWLYGDIWKCICGEFCCDVCFTVCDPQAGEPSYWSLEQLSNAPRCHDFRGCEGFVPGDRHQPGHVHREYCTTVPAGSLPLGVGGRPRVYDWTATLSFRNPCGEYGVIAGFDKGCVQVYQSH